MATQYFLSAFAIAIAGYCSAQYTVGSAAYDGWKLTQVQQPQQVPSPNPNDTHAVTGELRGGGAPCACWIEPDSSYTTLVGDSAWNGTVSPNADDGSRGPVPLPFNFQLYGQTWDTAYINVNGNISFGVPTSSFSIHSFPTSNYKMVTPFGADADLRQIATDTNIVSFKVTPTALYVTWTNVGYYIMNVDKVNSFQVIISDGTDPAIPGGNNVSFCYGNMQWTTGDASGGYNGFGGNPAIAGANAGDGTNYFQLGRFDHSGDDWNGASPYPDGVGWLTDHHFSFSTASADISPIFIGTECDTLDVLLGSSFVYPGWSTEGLPSIKYSRPLALQPNPAKDRVSLSWHQELQPSLMQVISADGSLMMTRIPEIGATRMKLDVSNLAPGIYNVRLTSSLGVSSAKLIHFAEY